MKIEFANGIDLCMAWELGERKGEGNMPYHPTGRPGGVAIPANLSATIVRAHIIPIRSCPYQLIMLH